MGARSWKGVFLGDSGKVFTTLFSRSSERQYALWDVVRMGICMCVLNLNKA